MIWALAYRNLQRYRRKTRATLLSMTSGFVAYALFAGYIHDTENLFEVTYRERLMYGDLIVQKKDTFADGLWADPKTHLDESDQKVVEQALHQISPTPLYSRFVAISGLVSGGSTQIIFLGLGYDLASGAQMRGSTWGWDALAGRPLGGDSEDEVVLGQSLARILGCTLSKPKTLFLNAGGYDRVERPFQCLSPEVQLTVTSEEGQNQVSFAPVAGIVDGVYREPDSRLVKMSLTKAQTLNGSKHVTYYAVAAPPGVTVKQLRAQLAAALAATPQLEVVSWKDHSHGVFYVDSLDFLGVFRDFTLATIFIVIFLSIYSAVSRAVLDRRAESATLRSLGFSRHWILLTHLAETFLLSVAASTLGVLVAILMALGVNHVGILYRVGMLVEKIPLQISLTPEIFMGGWLALWVIAWFTTLVVAPPILRRPIPQCLS